MNIPALIFNILGTVSIILASVVGGDKMKRILALLFLGNVFVGVGYLFEGAGINGAASCFLGAAQSVVSYCFRSKNKPIPKWVILLYALSFVVLNFAVAGTVTGPVLLAIVATLAFVMGIIQSKGAIYRFWTLMNMLLWGVYDIWTGTYSALVTHVILFVFTVIGMIVHDTKKKDKAA